MGRATRSKKQPRKHPRLAKRRYADGGQRKNILERDESQCRYCGQFVSNTTANMDHVKPWKMGGPTKGKNMVTCCQDCNKKKGNQTDWTPKPIGYFSQDLMLSPPKKPEEPKKAAVRHSHPYIKRDYVTVPEYQTSCKHGASPNCLRQRCLEERKIPFEVKV